MASLKIALSYKRSRFNHIILIMCVVGIDLLFINPLFVANDLYDPTRSGKIFFFTKCLAFLIPLLLVPILINIRQKPSVLQILVFLFSVWILVRGKTGGIIHDEKFFWYAGCIIFFFLCTSIIKCAIAANKEKVLLIPISLIVLAALCQSVFGQLQILNLFPVYHYNFIVTGTFFNPALLAGFLVACLPFALYLIKYKGSSLVLHKVFYYLGGATVIFALLVLPATKSRAAYLGALAIFAVWAMLKYKPFSIILKYINTRLQKTLAILLLVAIVSVSGIALFSMKKDSASGRLLIWKVTSLIIKEKPIAGHGFNSFQANFAPAQAKYFSSKQRCEREQALAGNVRWAFNEALQIFSELGIIGFILFLSIIGYSILVFVKTLLLKKDNSFILCAGLCIIGVFIVSLFSYSFYSLPINLVFFFALSIVAAYDKTILINNLAVAHNASIIIASLLLGSFYLIKTPITKEAYFNWKEAHDLYGFGNYDTASKEFEKAYPKLKYNGLFLQQYAKSLAMNEKYEVAIECLDKGKSFYIDVFWLITMGDCQKALGRFYDAELSYLQAAYCVPHKFYPHYLLAKLYDETEQKEKAIRKAKYLLNKHVKVPSTAIEEIKEEMKEILNTTDDSINIQ